jgi:hypothetical protein
LQCIRRSEVEFGANKFSGRKSELNFYPATGILGVEIFIQGSDNNFGNCSFPKPLLGSFLLLLSPLYKHFKVREKFLFNLKFMVAVSSRLK